MEIKCKKTILLLFTALIFFSLYSCSDNEDRFIKEGKKALEKDLINDARLKFSEGILYYTETEQIPYLLESSIYMEIAGLEKGTFLHESKNLDRISLDIETLASENFYLQLLLVSARTRAALYNLEYQKAYETIKTAEPHLKKLLQLEDTKKNKNLKLQISSICVQLLLYTELTEKPLPIDFLQYLIPAVEFNIEFNSILPLLQNSSITEIPKKTIIPSFLKKDIHWLLFNRILISKTLEKEKHIVLLEKEYTFFSESGSFCLDVYSAYFIARAVEERKPELALKHYLHVLPQLEELGKKDFHINTLSGLAVIYFKQGNYLSAFDYFQTVLPFYEKDDDYENTAKSKNYLASINKAFGNLSAAENLYLETLAIYKKLGNNRKTASVYNNLGIIYKDQQNYSQARNYFYKAISILDTMIESTEDPVKQTALYLEKYIKLNNLSEILISKAQYQEALDQYLTDLLVDIRSKNFTKTSLYATVNLNIASCTYFLIREEKYLSLEKCLPILTRMSKAKSIFTQLNEFVKVQEIQFLEGQIYFNTGSFEDAEKIYSSLKELFTESRNISHLAGVCYSLYLTNDALGKTKEATDNLKLSVRNYDKYIRMIPGKDGQENVYKTYLPYFKILIQRLINEGRIEEAFNFSEIMKARILLQQMKQQELDPFINIPKHLKNGLNELSIKETILIKEFENNFWFAKMSGDFVYIEEVKEKLSHLEKEKQEIFRSIRVINAHAADINEVHAVNSTEIQAVLKSDQLIINYIFLDNHFYAFLISKDTIDAVQLDSPTFKRKTLSDKIAVYRRKLENTYSDPSPEAKYLYSALVSPVYNIMSKYKHIIIIPSEDLFYLPFDALQNNKTGTYLIEQYPGIITYSISSTVLLTLKSKEAAVYSKPYYGIGDPDYQGRMNQLAFTAVELDETASLFGADSLVYKNLDATETRIKETNLLPYRYIHFSCHGMNYSDSSFLSFPALLLAAEPGDVNDGYLKHDEVSSLKLSAELVLLSACQTGLGKMTAGDGLVGLNQAFFIAGADSILSSLWSVSDYYTMVLITDFFKNLLDGKSKGMALKHAMLSVKTRVNNDYGIDHPFFWAPFIITGRNE